MIFLKLYLYGMVITIFIIVAADVYYFYKTREQTSFLAFVLIAVLYPFWFVGIIYDWLENKS